VKFGMRLAFVGLFDFMWRQLDAGVLFFSRRIAMNEIMNVDWKPAELAKFHRAEETRVMANCHANEEIRQALWILEADHARRIHECCRREPGHLDYFLENEKAMYRLLSAALGAFAEKCALCGWDSERRGGIRKALKAAGGAMFPMPELEGWIKAVEEKVRACPKKHSGLEVWRLMRMLRVKVEEPKAARIETEYYE
jgi:hypothetical protein